MNAKFVLEGLSMLSPKSQEDIEFDAREMDPDDLLELAVENQNEKMAILALKNHAYLSEDAYDFLHEKVDLSPYIGNSLVSNIKFINNKITFPDWDIIIDFIGDYGNKTTFVTDIINGDGERHLSYFGEDIVNSPVEFDLDNHKALSYKILDLLNKVLEDDIPQEFDNFGDLFRFVENSEDDEYIDKVLNSIKSTNDTVLSSKAEDAYMKQFKEVFLNTYEISDVNWNHGLKQYEGKITDNGKVKMWGASEYFDGTYLDINQLTKDVDVDLETTEDFNFYYDELKAQLDARLDEYEEYNELWN